MRMRHTSAGSVRDYRLSLTLQYCPWVPLERRLDAIAAAGFTHVNVPVPACERLLVEGDRGIELLRDQLEGRNLRVDWVHVPYSASRIYCNDRDQWFESLAANRLMLRLSRRLGARVAVIHAVNDDFPFIAHETTAREPLRRAFGLLLEQADREGLILATENLPESYAIPVVTELLEALPGLGLCLDAGHAHLSDTWDRFLYAFSSRIVALHLHDNHQAYDEHLIPGYGTIDYDWLIQQLMLIGYGDVWGLECIVKKRFPAGGPRVLAVEAYRSVARRLQSGRATANMPSRVPTGAPEPVSLP